MSAGRQRHPSSFATQGRALGAVWVALLALMLTSLGSSYLSLGTGNAVASIGIAAIKALIVAWWFMHLRVESATLRTVALVGLFMLALLATLSGLDYATRPADPALVQSPQQIEPWLQKGLPGKPPR